MITIAELENTGWQDTQPEVFMTKPIAPGIALLLPTATSTAFVLDFKGAQAEFTPETTERLAWIERAAKELVDALG